MRRLGRFRETALGLAVMLAADAVFAQEGPEPIGTVVEPSEVSNIPSEQAPSGPGIAAPRDDYNSVYTDAFMNPDTLMDPNSQTAGAMQGLFKGPRYYRITFGYDQLRWGRTSAGNQVLTQTSPDLFDTGDPIFNADPNNDDKFLTIISPDFPLQDGLIQTLNPNTPNAGIVVRPGDPNPNNLFSVQGVYPGIGEVLVLGQNRMQTDQLGFGREYGFRPRISIEFNEQTKFTLQYFTVSDFQSRIIEDVSGASFLMKVISDEDDPFQVQYQRFGYLLSNFQTADPRFAGERRRQVGDDPSQNPHSPFNELPAFNFFVPTGTSRDVPREPTINDSDLLDNLNGDESQPFPSFLWRDGEVAIADYNFSVQGGDAFLEHRFFEFANPSWKIMGIAGVKYLQLNEGFTFLFADLAPPGDIAGSGYTARSGFDRGAANGFARSQPSIETVAITNVSVDNNILGPMVGLHTQRPFLEGLFEVDLMGRGTFGANFMQRDSYLIRGDGLVGFQRSKEETLSSGVLECQLGLNFCPHPRFKLRAGWEAMWLMSVGTAISNIEFNLDRSPRPSNNDSVLFHGWYFGGEFSY